jgi:hypothetical protein
VRRERRATIMSGEPIIIIFGSDDYLLMLY